MRSALLVVVPAVAALPACPLPAVCDDGDAPAPVPVAATAAGYAPYGHSHNDYAQDRPLEDALAAGLYSVEADVGGADLKVQHTPVDLAKGTLAELYLDPLQAIVDDRGSVHGDELPFTLWIDLKDGASATTDALDAALRRYETLLTTFSTDGVLERAVTVVITGDAAGKERMVESAEPRPYARDDNAFDRADPPSDPTWKFYALSWSGYLSWSGEGDAPAEQTQRAACIVDHAHRDGRKLRFFGAPDVEASWRFQLDVGVDYVGTDDPAALGAFLETYTP